MQVINPKNVYRKWRDVEIGNICVHVAMDIMGYTIDLPPDGYKHAYNYTLYPILREMGFTQTRAKSRQNLRHAWYYGRIPKYCLVSVNDHMFCVKDNVVYDHGKPLRKFVLSVWEHPDMEQKALEKKAAFDTLRKQYMIAKRTERNQMEKWLPHECLDVIHNTWFDKNNDDLLQVFLHDDDLQYRKKVFAAIPIEAKRYIIRAHGMNMDQFIENHLS